MMMAFPFLCIAAACFWGRHRLDDAMFFLGRHTTKWRLALRERLEKIPHFWRVRVWSFKNTLWAFLFGRRGERAYSLFPFFRVFVYCGGLVFESRNPRAHAFIFFVPPILHRGCWFRLAVFVREHRWISVGSERSVVIAEDFLLVISATVFVCVVTGRY
ncbi:hypothetical protein B0T26DRAFT_90266 [Lasiosphaeria miniovina]|uniref:Secreted protein n=1 Tax=Lasiosphaeria miniovina TaxID=1954250 RepID=A0AA40EGS1_9PEZI|nr:uncharacterized protein B0T26DRAFT_90266 [Lasiosphaeria miniovina]KAK0734988.1 hypothetical protein B0T26DRAFT_90266 [Lasiosphaeria miniovina]